MIGRLRSVAYGPTVVRDDRVRLLSRRRSREGTELEVDVFDERVPATIAADVLVDPGGARMRG